MSFTIYEPGGQMFIQWFSNIDDLIKSMIKHPTNVYHRNWGLDFFLAAFFFTLRFLSSFSS